uniref:CSON005257 protein n=1 Tax=Culicoides sonorensis TaxID=179676 RepID=A0A336JZG9_CULSO
MDYLLFIVKELQKSGRVRQNTHRWTRAQTDKLLEMVFAETEGDPNKYEKPTHQIFYKKILEKNNDELFGLTWTLLDNKMRNLRTQYLKAIEWLKNTGSGLQSEGKHKSISEYISKICPFYDKLHDIFAEKRSINTVNVVESSSIDSDALMQLLDSEGDSQQPYVIEDDPSFHLDGSYSETSVIVSGEQNDHLSQESCSIQQNDHLFQELANNYQQNTTSTSTTSVMSPIIPNFLSPSETEPQRSQKKRRVGQGGSLNTLVELQEKRLKLEELKMQSEIELHDILIKTRGQSVTLECPLDVKACGELHSEMIELQLLSIDHSPLGPSTRLHIKSLQVSDDDSYLCESTYLEPLESCDNTGAYNIKLNIYVPPSSIVMLDESGHLIRNGTKTKPLREGETLTKSCEAIGARPTPKIGWYKNGKRLQDTVTAEEIDGLYTVKSKFSLLLTRGEVQGQLECLVETPALESMVSNFLLLDMEIRPTSIDLSGVEHHVVKGTKVLLQCEVKGARPAANVTFYNNSQIVTDGNKGISISTIVEEKKDGTFETVSQMIFTATRFENGASIRCEADNIVMRDDGERPLHDTLVLEVMYPPVVNVRPNNITTNETESFLLFCEYDANPASLERVTWLKNGEILNTNQSRYEGGHPEQTALLVKNALRSDIGTYICELQNSIGSDASDNKINVDIQYVPTVEIDMEPDSPLIENNESNVTLYCNVLQGNPLALLKVRWFLDGQLLKELPECEDDVNDEDSLCEIDPSKMLLQNVGRDFHGNYSCEGFNAAGWGDVSNEAELLVHYEPGNASLAFYPPIPVKRKSVTFTCSVDDPGNPSATRYRWLRGNKPVMDVVTSQWTVDPVGLDSRTNFSCYAYNEGGDAPPAFIQKLHPYTGALFSAKNASLTCRVECVPTCSITWFKDGNGIEKSDTHYSIKETLLPADPSTGDFESVLSILYFNITAWQNEKLDIFKDNANYSCVSTHNSVGTGVRNPPENVTVWSSDTGKSEIMVEEGQMPQRILCSAKAYPEPSYIWIRNDEVIAKGNALIVNKPMQHADAGIYSCIAKNKHGNGTAEANINIRFKPNCTIARKEVDDDDGLVCSAIGNPSNIDFVWSLKPENETLDSSNVKQTSSLVAKVGSHYIVFIDRSTYSFTRPCDNSLSYHNIIFTNSQTSKSFVSQQSNSFLEILPTSNRDSTVVVPSKVENTNTNASTKTLQSSLTNEAPKSPPKWPLRPGVMVHVKTDTKENLHAARTQSPTNNINTKENNCCSRNETYQVANVSIKRDVDKNNATSSKNPFRVSRCDSDSVNNLTNSLNVNKNLNSKNDELVNFSNSKILNQFLKKLKLKRARSCVNETKTSITVENETDEETGEESSFRRRNGYRFRIQSQASWRGTWDTWAWFGSNKSTKSNKNLVDNNNDHINGIECTEKVVTYKRTPVCINNKKTSEQTENNENQPSESRKRKKDHDKLYAPGALTEPGEYENLPFHGLQTAPNKSACLTTTNSNNTNVVRVAPRQKFQVTNQSSLSSSSSHNISSSSQFPIQSFNYINYQSHLIPNTIIYDKNQSSKNPFLVKGGLNKCSDNKFNTLTKSSPTRKSPQFYSMRKCKRHHSYCSPKSNDKVGKLGITSENDNKPNLSFIDYEQPVYENLTDSIQIHEAKLPVNEASSTDSKSGIIRFNNNYNFHHSNVKVSGKNFKSNISDYNNHISPNKHKDQTIGSSKDRMSIHKSDSGISNSSYEYLPQPAPRINSRTDNSKRDIFENDISNMNAPIYMNLSQNNSFYTRPSNFLPKELFPSSSAILRKESTCSNKSLRRPIKLPLRKHHSFHFQSSQTVTGLVKQRRQQHQHQLQRFNSKEEVNISPISSAINLNIDNNDIINWDDGEIIFKPYDKNSAFKPIQPVNHQLNKYIPNSVDSDLISYTSESYNFDRNNREYLDKNNSISSGSDAKSSSTSSNSSNDRGKLPRICGTSLKRHLIDSNNMSTAESKRKDDLDTTLYHGISENIANSIPKPSRSQYATIKFPEPLSGIDLADDIIYADLNENENYGPINYKAASIYALVKKGKSGELKETTANKKQEFLRINEHSTSPLLNLN